MPLNNIENMTLGTAINHANAKRLSISTDDSDKPSTCFLCLGVNFSKRKVINVERYANSNEYRKPECKSNTNVEINMIIMLIAIPKKEYLIPLTFVFSISIILYTKFHL